MMDKNEVKEFIREQVKKRMDLLGVSRSSLNDETDLVKEGIYDSLAFVDLLADCEHKFGVNIDLEKYQPGEFTRVGRLVEMILKAEKQN